MTEQPPAPPAPPVSPAPPRGTPPWRTRRVGLTIAVVIVVVTGVTVAAYLASRDTWAGKGQPVASVHEPLPQVCYGKEGPGARTSKVTITPSDTTAPFLQVVPPR